MKVLLVTLAIGEQYLKEYKRLFYESQRNYALKNGYDFRVVTDFLDPMRQNASVSFHKILVCSQKWSEPYDFIVFIDADILINPNSPPIHSCMDYGDCIGIADEYSQPTPETRLALQRKMGWETSARDYYKLCGFNLNTDKVFNTGVLVMQPKLHKDFLRAVFDRYVQHSVGHPRGFHFEQSCIGYELQKANNYKVLDNKFNAVWNLTKLTLAVPIKTYFDENYFLHLAGHTDYDKVSQLK